MRKLSGNELHFVMLPARINIRVTLLAETKIIRIIYSRGI